MKKRRMESAEHRSWRHRLAWKKVALYLVLIISTITVFFVSFSIFDDDFDGRVRPQINRAIVQVARLLPQLEQNETMLRETYEQMIKSWETVFKSGNFSLNDVFSDSVRSMTDAEFEKVIDDTLSWLNRVTKLKIGREGYVTVVSKENNRIVAHPDEKMVGVKFFDEDNFSIEKGIVSIKSIKLWTSPEDIDIDYMLYYPRLAGLNLAKAPSYSIKFLQQAIYGGILEYDDYYIICGIPVMEYLGNVTNYAMLVTIIYLVLMGLFVKWICLVMDIRRETAHSMRNKLISYTIILCIVFFCISSYYQVLSNVTDDLKTMSRHADAAVETLNTYEAQRDKLDNFLNKFYVIQSQIASALIDSQGVENLTWQNMQRFADALQIKYVYLFDKSGKVVVTNSPYDHLQVSDKPEDFTYQFWKVLDGVENLILPPMQDEWLEEYQQYVAASRRDSNNKCDGFVLISIDPALRDRLLEAFKVNTVLDNLIIGLPEYAIAVNKETLKIEGTTGLGYKGSSIEEMGITEDMLANSFNGFLMIDGKEYYAGVSKSADYYLVPVVRRTSNLQAFKISMKLVIVMAVSAIVIILLTLFRYKKTVIDSYPKEEIPDAEPETEDEMKTELFESLLVLPKLRAQEKSGMEDRWHMNNVPKDQQTPEERIARSVYRLLLLFCLLILVPTLYDNLQDGSNPNKLNNLAYVISGNWQKGFNIFAVTSCIFLMSSMYVVGMMLNQILYRIAKVSDMRVETVCLLLRNASKYICVIMFVYYGLAKFGVDTQTLLASAGIVSLMISFGAKDLVSDIIAGFFTIFEGTYKVGDFITVGNWFGTVVEIGLRTTKVRFFAETKIFSNSSIRDIINADGTVTRMTLKAPFPYDADLLEIENILKEELPQIAERIDGLVKPPKYEGVESLGESSVSLMISILVEMPKKKAALRQLNREILLMYKRRGIAVPYNQIVVHNANDSENRSIIIKDKEQV